MIADIKEKIESLKNKKIKISVDVGRNKNEIYDGYIENTYKNIWTFKTDCELKSFSYNDVLIRQVVILS